MKPTSPTNQKLTVEIVSHAYGVSSMTVHSWMKRGVLLEDFYTPRMVAEKLRKTASRNSPRLTLLEKLKTQLAIIFRLSVSGAIKPTN